MSTDWGVVKTWPTCWGFGHFNYAKIGEHISWPWKHNEILWVLPSLSSWDLHFHHHCHPLSFLGLMRILKKLWLQLRLVTWPSPNGGVVCCQHLLTLPIKLFNVLEMERNLPRSLPLWPVLKEGVKILEVHMVELSEQNAMWQVLCKDVIPLALSHLRPWDSPPAPACCNP